jgi:hypothetical protein
MFRKLFAAMLVIMTSSAFATVPWPLEIIDHLDNATLVIFVNESDIESSPKWSPDTGKPPFGLEEMLQAIGEWKKRNDCSAADRIEKIELKPIAHHEKEGRWYYLVQIKNVEKGQHSHRYLAVLMNGKTIAAVQEPESYK